MSAKKIINDLNSEINGIEKKCSALEVLINAEAKAKSQEEDRLSELVASIEDRDIRIKERHANLSSLRKRQSGLMKMIEGINLVVSKIFKDETTSDS